MKDKNEIILEDGITYKVVYCKYITKNGKRIFPKNGCCFRFLVKI